jgi:hemin uptake protein HemP
VIQSTGCGWKSLCFAADSAQHDFFHRFVIEKNLALLWCDMPDSHPADDTLAPVKPGETAPERPVKVVRVEDLFGDDREIWIDHAGERYRLRITRRNKLILQK